MQWCGVGIGELAGLQREQQQMMRVVGTNTADNRGVKSSMVLIK